jgi:tetratricopeptide (TPR) repeat protein
MEFENHTGDNGLDPYRRSLQEYLIINLEQLDQLHVYSEKQLNQILGEIEQRETTQDPVEILNSISLKEPVSHFILGSMGGDKENLAISAQIWDARSQTIIYQDIEPPVSIGQLNQMMKTMGAKIKSKFMATLSGTEAVDSIRGIITTTSSEARKLYEEGALNYNKHKYEESIDLLERAVDLDPGFAMAYRLMACSNYYLGYENKVKENLEIALKQERVSESERLLIQGDYAYIVEQDNRKAIEIYQNLIEMNPEYDIPKLMLAALYMNLEEWDLALEWYNKVLESSPSIADNAWNNIAFICMAKGWYDFARNIFQRNRDAFKSKSYCHRNVTHTYIYKGEYDLALLEIEKALSIEPDEYPSKALMGNIYQGKEDFTSARGYYSELMASPDPGAQAEGRFWMVRLYLSQGKYKNCVNELREAITFAQNNELAANELKFLVYQIYLNYRQGLRIPDSTDRIMKLDKKQALFWRGLAYIQQNKIEEAEKTAWQLSQLIEELGIRKHMRYCSYLQGMIALSNNELEKSISHFSSAISDMPSVVYSLDDHSMYFDSIASAYYKNGDLTKAGEYYERITKLTWGKLPFGDIYAKSHYWLGRIQQEQGNEDEAIKSLSRFLALWKDADIAHPEIKDAKKRISLLGGGASTSSFPN